MKDKQVESYGYSFGTFKGVFTPSILTILGVVMFLRLGWVYGHMGLGATWLIITLATLITFLTGLSLSALSTNMKVKGGGAYYILSRSLGIEAGAAVGIPLFLAQTLGISFYIAGFSESVNAIYPSLDPTIIGIVTLCLMTLLAYFSADLALKSQFLIMAAIALALVSFFTGGAEYIPTDSLAPSLSPTPSPSFWIVFAVFFPAVTGIEAGIAMSGDLKNPARSLPIGTLAAILTGYIIYLAIPLFFSLVLSEESQALLTADPLVMQKVARFGWAVVLGIWAASLSSALGALLGAPRTLQALAQDKIMPSILARGYGAGKDPRFATVVCFIIALAGILLGDLNLIAPILSMFFLTSYGALNLSASFEELISPASWRPKFRVSWKISLAGFLACLAVMVMINPGATIIAISTTLSLYLFLQKLKLESRWGDLREGVMRYSVRDLLYKLNALPESSRNWQPNILIFSGAPRTRWHLIGLGKALSQKRGFMTVAAFVPQENGSQERIDNLTQSIQTYLARRNVQSMVHTQRSVNPIRSAKELIGSYGFGPLRPNMILFGTTENEAHVLEFTEAAVKTYRTRRNLLLVRETPHDSDPVFEDEKRIDVWVRDASPNTPLMLALSSILEKSSDWKGSRIILKRTVDCDTHTSDSLRNEFESKLKGQRLSFEVELLQQSENTPFFDVMRESSKDAQLVILGMRAPGENESAEQYAHYYTALTEATTGLPTTVFLLCGEQIDFKALYAEDDTP